MSDNLNQDSHILNLMGHFTWDFGMHFFIETEVGNFIWSCPDYNGDNSLVATPLTYAEYIAPDYGRDKGEHIIGRYINSPIYWGIEAVEE